MEWKNQQKIINSPRHDFMNWSLQEHLEVRSTPLLYSVKRAVQVWRCLTLCYCCPYEFAGKGQMADRGCYWSARLSVEMVKNKWKPTCTFVSISHYLSLTTIRSSSASHPPPKSHATSLWTAQTKKTSGIPPRF